LLLEGHHKELGAAEPQPKMMRVISEKYTKYAKTKSGSFVPLLVPRAVVALTASQNVQAGGILLYEIATPDVGLASLV
jgi:hypothetical protein